jgi:CheY-like chemotaxis protein
MYQPTKSDQRRFPRKRVLKGGVIAFSARHATLPCVVRDVTPQGARLQVQNGAGVPDSFELIIELDGLEAPCEVVWRKPGEVGVAFIGAATVGLPRRTQIVESSSWAVAKPSLRRNLQTRGVTPGSPGLPPVAPAARERSTAEPQFPPAPTAPPLAPMHSGAKAIPILIADDDPDDRLLIGDAFRESNFSHPIAFVEDGEDLLAYLRAEGRHAGRTLPGLILLDLNMPRMDGRTALMHMKADHAFRRIPVIVLTTSTAEDDIQRTYDLGVSAYIPKPGSYSELLELVLSLNAYWMRFVAVPSA